MRLIYVAVASAVLLPVWAEPPSAPPATERRLSLAEVPAKRRPAVVKAVSFALNSLTREAAVVRPREAGDDLVFDLADYGIDAKAFDALPWSEAGRVRPKVSRAEWFVAVVFSPSHYYKLLGVNTLDGFRKRVSLDEAAADKLGLSRGFVRRHGEVAATMELVTRHSTVCGSAWEFGAVPIKGGGSAELDGPKEQRLYVAHLPNGLAAYAMVGRDGKLRGYADDKVAYDLATPLADRRFAVARSCVLTHRGFENFGEGEAMAKDALAIMSSEPIPVGKASRLLRSRFGTDLGPLRRDDQRLYERALKATNGLTPKENAEAFAEMAKVTVEEVRE